MVYLNPELIINPPELDRMDLIAIIKFVLAPLKIKSLGDWLQDLQPGGKRTAQVLSVENDGRVPVDLGVDADIPAELYRRQRRS